MEIENIKSILLKELDNELKVIIDNLRKEINIDNFTTQLYVLYKVKKEISQLDDSNIEDYLNKLNNKLFNIEIEYEDVKKLCDLKVKFREQKIIDYDININIPKIIGNFHNQLIVDKDDCILNDIKQLQLRIDRVNKYLEQNNNLYKELDYLNVDYLDNLEKKLENNELVTFKDIVDLYLYNNVNVENNKEMYETIKSIRKNDIVIKELTAKDKDREQIEYLKKRNRSKIKGLLNSIYLYLNDLENQLELKNTGDNLKTKIDNIKDTIKLRNEAFSDVKNQLLHNRNDLNIKYQIVNIELKRINPELNIELIHIDVNEIEDIYNFYYETKIVNLLKTYKIENRKGK